MDTDLANQFKAARRVSVPLVAVTTPDPAAAIEAICAAVAHRYGAEGGKPDPENGEAPHLVWDIAQGLRARNEAAKAVLASLVSGDFDPTVGNPLVAIGLGSKLPAECLLFIHLGHRWLADPAVVQAIWNLRDLFKMDRRTLVLLGPSIDLPAELQGDVVVFDEPLPDPGRLDAIIREQHSLAGLAPDPEAIPRAVEAVQGLPAFQAEQVVAMSLNKGGLDVAALWERKRRQIELTPGLKVNREGATFADVGGVEAIKGFLGRILHGQARPNCIVHLEEIEKMLAGAAGGHDTSGVTQDQLGTLLTYMQDQSAVGCIFVGPPGCLCGQTQLLYRRGKRNTGRRITLERLYRKFNGLSVGEGRGESTPWHIECGTYLHSYDHASGEVFYNEVVSVLSSGVKPCVRVTLEDGTFTRMTADHPVLTPDGFVHAADLSAGDEVICRGSMRATKRAQRSPRKERVVVHGLKYYAAGFAANVVESGLNNMAYDDYVRALKADPGAGRLTCLPSNLEVHHKNTNSLDDRPENLQILAKPDHTREHDPIKRLSVEYTRVLRVASVVPDGERPTYDIQMRSPANNFATADGLFVHNTSKSLLAKAAGNEAGIPTVQLDMGGVKQGLVGASEQNLRAALKVITSVSNGRSLWLATSNGIGDLPPELRRRFTLGTFFFELPTAEERAAIWQIWLRKYDMLPIGKKAIPDDDGWTGAEIRQCCDIAWRLGCTLHEAAAFVVPVSRSAGEQIERLRKAADGRFLSASYPGVYRVNPKGEVNSTPRGRRLAIGE